MPTSPLLKRLLRVRELQQEQTEAALKRTSLHLQILKEALYTAHARQARGRDLFINSAGIEHPTDRLAGLFETQIARAHQQKLKTEIRQAELLVEERMKELEASHQELRKGELLRDAMEVKANAESRRRFQKEIDELHRNRSKRAV